MYVRHIQATLHGCVSLQMDCLSPNDSSCGDVHRERDDPPPDFGCRELIVE